MTVMSPPFLRSLQKEEVPRSVVVAAADLAFLNDGDDTLTKASAVPTIIILPLPGIIDTIVDTVIVMMVAINNNFIVVE